MKNKKSETLKELAHLQGQIELLEQALLEVKNSYFKKMKGSFNIESDSYSQDLPNSAWV